MFALCLLVLCFHLFLLYVCTDKNWRGGATGGRFSCVGCIMKIAHLNVRSLFANLQAFNDYFKTCDYDVVAVTETWLNARIPDEYVIIRDNYCFVRQDRESRGGRSRYVLK